MKDIQFKKISVDDVYVSILTRTRVTSPEGWTRMEPVAKQKINTGSIIIDAVGQALAQCKRACEWLKCTDIETEEVARRSGFTSRSALSHFFIKWLKCSPSDYRRRNRPADFRERYEWE